MTPTSVKRTGDIVHHPELRYSTGGLAICTFRILTSHPMNIEYRIVCFGELAESITEEMNQHDNVTIWGYFKTRTWKGRDGKEYQVQELRIRKIKVNRT